MKKIHQYNIIRLLPALLLIVLGYTSCQKTTLNAPGAAVTFRPISDFLKNNYEFTLFYAAIQKAGLVDSLNAAGPFTVFAPDDNAFNLEGIHAAADFDKWSVDSLKFFIKYHVINRKLFVSDIPDAIDNLYLNADGINLYIDNLGAGRNPPLIVCGDSVNKSDLVMSNGIIHELTRVIKGNPGNLQNYLLGNPDLSIFVAALKKAEPGLWDSLKTATPYTILAPSNEAYLKYGMTLDSVNIRSAASLAILVMPSVYYQHHVFISDAGYLGSFESITSGPYTMEINPYATPPYQFSGGAIPLTNAHDPTISEPQPPATYLAPPWGLTMDNIATNGIVDIINDVPALIYR
jgi:uncharacterized surface protein with fasciclin (FAS1) repeats